MSLAAELRSQVTDAGFGLGWAAVRHMPEAVAEGLFRRVADRTWSRRGAGVRRLEANLRRVVPDASDEQLAAMSKEGMRRYLRYWCEVFRLPSWSPERVVGSFVCEDEHNLADGLASGRGVVAVLPHMGNWDHAGAWACLAHQPLTTVAESLEPASLAERFIEYRASLGMEVLSLGAPGVLETLADRLRTGGFVCLLGDRDLTRAGVPVTFFGETATMPAGPALLAVTTGAALLPVTMWYEGPLSLTRIHPEVPVPTGDGRALGREEQVAVMTQQVADVFEAGIREHPQDWHMLQRLWRADLDPAKAPTA